jgi:hypothetical protein
MRLKIKCILFMLLPPFYCHAQDAERPYIMLVVCVDLNLMGLGTLVRPSIHIPNIDNLLSKAMYSQTPMPM